MKEKKAQHIIVKGMVQGVGYRLYCSKAAAENGLSGSVKNLENGDVEIFVQGDRAKINNFISEITRKDRSFNVVDIAIEDASYDSGKKDFRILY
ncbi:MAG: acylphosphatase [Candidatus Goldiibacteriota bacterium]